MIPYRFNTLRAVAALGICCAAVAQFYAQAPAVSSAPISIAAEATTSDVPADAAQTEKEAAVPPNTLRDLPPGLDPNPPATDDLKSSKLTWKGEYEATKEGAPVLGPDNRPIPVLYNAKGKRVRSRIKPLHSHPLTVVAGTLTVDGWTGKARLNYDIPSQSFLYFSAPSIGTVIVSQTAFPGSREQKAALDGKTLTVHIDDHDLQLASDQPLGGKKPESVWVRLDPEFHRDLRYPVMGFGSVIKAPYAWPGAKLLAAKGTLDAPPLPESMRPAVASPVCIAQPNHPCARPAAPAASVAETAQPARPPASTPVQ